MGLFEELGEKAKDAGKFISDSAKDAKDAAVEAWPSEEIQEFGDKVKNKSNELAQSAGKKLDMAGDAIAETSDEFVDGVVKAKDEYVSAWKDMIHDVNLEDIQLSECIHSTVNAIDSYFSEPEHAHTDSTVIMIDDIGDLWEYNSVEEAYADASYYSMCRLNSTGTNESITKTLNTELHKLYSDSKFTNMLAKQFGVPESSITEVVDDLVDKTLETAKTVAYIDFRIAVGAVQVAENVYKGVAVTYENAVGNNEKANEIMSKNFADELREAGEEVYNQNETIQNIGDVAEDVGEAATECAVAVAALTTGTASVAAVAVTAGATTTLSLNNVGESLQNSYDEQGEVTDEAVIAAGATGIATAVATGVGSQVHAKISSSIPKIAESIAKADTVTEKVGARITGTLVNAAYGANVASSMSITDKVDKIVKVGLGIEESIDVKEEVKDYVTNVAGAAALAGGTYYLSSVIKDTKAFETIIKNIKGEDFKLAPDIYESIYNIEKTKLDYIKEIKSYSEFADTLDDVVMGDVEKMSSDIVAEKRAEFNKMKDDLIEEWERIYNQEWPTYKEDIYNEFGELVKKKGWKYDAHHIKPLSMGGDNIASNITPLSYDVHSDHNGVHAIGSAYNTLENLLKGGSF